MKTNKTDANSSLRNWHRRDFLRNAVLGTMGLGAAYSFKKMGLTSGLEKSFHDWMASQTQSGGWDAFTQLKDALRGGPALLGVSNAFAADTRNVAFLDCFMAISSDCRHFLNLSSFGAANNIFSTLASFKDSAGPLSGMVRDHSVYRGAKVNEWFGELVRTGKSQANAIIPGFENLVKDIPANKLCFTSFCSYVGRANHGFGHLDQVGTLPFLIQKAFNLSPLGIASLSDSVNVMDEQAKSVALGKSTRRFVDDLAQFVSPSYFARSPLPSENVLLQLDALVDNVEAKELRMKWLTGLVELQKIVGSWMPYKDLSDKDFNAFGMVAGMGSTEDAGRCASIALAGKMAASGLGMVSTISLPTHDFHEDKVDRTTQVPGQKRYTMQHAYMETGTGLNIWANELIKAKKDGVAFIRIPSGRSANWVDDSNTTTSGLMVVVRGADNSPLADMQNMYYGPSASGVFVETATLDWAPGLMGLAGGQIPAAAVEGAVASVVAKASGQTFTLDMQTQIGKI
jgi:hypothetical protein